MTNLLPKSRRMGSRFIPSTVTLTCCHPKGFVPQEKVGLIAADSLQRSVLIIAVNFLGELVDYTRKTCPFPA